MKKFSHIIAAVSLSLIMLILVTLIPKTIYPELSIQTRAGDSDSIQDYIFDLEYLDPDYIYSYNGFVKQDNYGWSSNKREELVKHNQYAKIPLGQRHKIIYGYPLKDDNVLNLELNDQNQLTYYLSHPKSGEVQQGQYRLLDKHVDYFVYNYAQRADNLYLLFYGRDKQDSSKNEAIKLVIDLTTLEVIEDVEVDLPPELINQSIRDEHNRLYSPSHWNFILYSNTSRDSVYSEDQLELLIIDPETLRVERIKSTEEASLLNTYQIYDTLYMVESEENEGLRVVTYSIENQTYQEIFKTDFDSIWTHRMGGDNFTLAYLDEENVPQIRAFSTDNHDLIYEGFVENNQEEYQAVSIY